MTIDERQRYQLHQALEAHLGTEAAATLMAHLPPVGWADVATKRDLDNLGDQLRAEIAGVRTELGTGLADVRTELGTGLAGVRTELRTGLAGVHTGLADVRTELRTGLADVRTEIADVRTEIHKTARTMVGAVAAIVTVVAAVTNLFG